MQRAGQGGSAGGRLGRGNWKYSAHRRPPPKVENKPNDIYVCTKSNFTGQVEKCKKLLDGDYQEIFIHGLDEAIPRTINIALELKKFYQGTVDYSTKTDTVHVIDDLIPTDDSSAPSFEKRIASSIDIHVFRTVKIP